MGIFQRAARIAKSYWYGWEDDHDPYQKIKNSEDEELKKIIEELNNPKKEPDENQESSTGSSAGGSSHHRGSQRGHSHKNSQPHSSVSNKELYNACKVLGVPASASVEEIKAAYKKKILRYHPDRVATLEAEKKAEAEKISREINHAYQVMKKHKGFH